MSDSSSDLAFDISDIQSTSGLSRYTARIRQWFILDGDRNLVSATLAAGVFVTTVLVGTYGPVPVREFLTEGVSPAAALVELLKTIVSLVTIVLSINQLVLSPGLGPVGAQRERLEDSMSLRQRTEGVIASDVSPESPRRFLQAVLAAVGEQAALLADRADPEREVGRRLARYADEVTDRVEHTEAELEGATFGTFSVLPAVVVFDISGKVRTARHLRRHHAEDLSEPEREALDEMVDRLELFATARAYFKNIYIRSEYINFSRALLFAGLPALLLTFWASQMYSPGVFPGATLGVENRLWFLSGAVTVALVPFTLLIAYVSRLATLTQSTLFIGPFVAGGENEEPDGDERP